MEVGLYFTFHTESAETCYANYIRTIFGYKNHLDISTLRLTRFPNTYIFYLTPFLQYGQRSYSSLKSRTLRSITFRWWFMLIYNLMKSTDIADHSLIKRLYFWHFSRLPDLLWMCYIFQFWHTYVYTYIYIYIYFL